MNSRITEREESSRERERESRTMPKAHLPRRVGGAKMAAQGFSFAGGRVVYMGIRCAPL